MPSLPFFQAHVPPLPKGIDLTGQTALVTGATKGIGLEICRQFLAHNLSTLILAVRNVPQGEAVKVEFLAVHPKANIDVIKFDAADTNSVKQFASTFQSKYTELHIAMLNAGLASFRWETTNNGHEIGVQVNYLANILISLELFPLLEATSDKIGRPTRLTWTGSTSYRRANFGTNGLPPGETPISHIDKTTQLDTQTRYSNSKLLVTLWLLELSNHVSSQKVIVNNFCPGMVSTGMPDILPLLLRLPVKAYLNWRGRSVDKAGWVALNAAILAGKETHGRLLSDMNLEEYDFLDDLSHKSPFANVTSQVLPNRHI